MRQPVKYLFILATALSLLVSCSRKTKGLPDLRETYGYNDTRPFGGKAAHDILQNAYPNKEIELVKKDFNENYQWNFDSSSLYFSISNFYYVNNEDAESLLDFVYKGNTAFIASDYIDTVLLNKIYCKQSTDFETMINGGAVRNTSVKYGESLQHYKDTTSYFYYPFNNYFSRINGTYARIVGYNDSDSANYIVFFWGRGRLFLHAEPHAFSNYFLLTRDNYRYMEALMQLMPANVENIYWDNVHNMQPYRTSTGNGSKGSSLNEIMKYPAFARAFWILLALLLLYIFFNSKRRQRIIPVTKPVINNSVEFAEAIAGLYLTKKDNKLIAEKMITYFNEHMRSKYFITMTPADQGYADMLSRKTGVSPEVTNKLTVAIQKVPGAATVTDGELLILNGLIEHFFKIKN